MEEGSDVHMETDVSSTTEDSLDRQEVTGSNGTVELVIVVEKVAEEINEKNEKPMETEDSVVAVPDEHSMSATALKETKLKSPIKQNEPQEPIDPPTKKLETPKMALPSSSSTIIEVSVSVNTEQEIVDPSGKSKEEKSPNVDFHTQVTTEVDLTENSDSQQSNEKTTIKEPQPQEILKTNTNISEPEKSSTTECTNIKKNYQPDIPNNVIQGELAMEGSNDSQIETNSDTSEKEHNKSISRELKSLINSAKESKIISECTQLTSKTRKSRVMLDSPNTTLNTSVDADKIQGTRRNSNNSQKSNCSEKSDKLTLKRSMRSQNPEFVSKVKQFLNSVTGKNQKDDDITDDEIEEKVHKSDETASNTSTPKKRKLEVIVMNKTTKLRSDSYCWRCHWAIEQVTNEKTHQPMLCTVCPRSFHFKCLSGAERNKISNEKTWVCPDCLIVLHAESSETRSPAMKKISLGMLCELLQHALERMMDLNGVEPFMTPVDRTAFPDYDKYVVHPMDLSLMKANITKGLYGSTEAFLTDAQWILHNSIIFNTLQSKLTGGARALVRSCRAEMGEIEACPECYAAAHARRPTWFTDVCSTPHILLWAKLKGFPYWPAKGMSVSAAGLVDVRFFGAHDRAWVPAKDCFLYSEKDPNNFRTKRQDILDSMQEAEQHIRNISRKYGKFVYPPFKTQFEPNKLNEQLKMMIPTFEGEIRVPLKQDKTSNGSPAAAKEKSRSNSKSSKSSCNDGDISEIEDPLSMSQKSDSVDGTEEDFSSERNKIIELDDSKTKDNKETENVKKRRRSQLEEAIITILDNYTVEKRKRLDEAKTENDPEPSSSKETNQNDKIPEKAKDNQEENTNVALKDEEPPKNVAKEKSEPLLVAPLKICFGAIKNGKQTAKVTNVKESPRATISNEKSLIAPKPNTPKEEKIPPQKLKMKIDKLFIDKSKGEKVKSEKRRNSKSNKSTNGNTTPKMDKSVPEKKNEKVEEPSTSTKEKQREYVAVIKNKADLEKPTNDKNNTTPTNSKPIKDRVNFDDDTSLAVLARENNKTSVITSMVSGLPTISSVRSLSTVATTSITQTTTTTTATKMTEVIIEGNPNASIFTPTSTESIRTMKEATTKLQKLRADTEPLVGRVGVRAFARMTSPERSKTTNDVQVEVKTEPIDLEDADRHMEKMDLMNAFKLRPVNPPSNLREVRMNEVVITPLNRRMAPKAPEIRPRAKKTFPHPKKPEDGQLNGKNSMVYIPIQPPATQPPRAARPAPAALAAHAAHATPAAALVSHATHASHAIPAQRAAFTTTSANIVNTVTSPLVPVITSMSPAATTTSHVGQSIPTIGQVPTTVHTVPLMTSVNGQWMFSLQPVMSVGGVDAQTSPPLLNGVGERGGLVQATVVPAAPAAHAPAPAPPAAPAAPAAHASAQPTATLAVITPAPLTPSAQINRPATESSSPGEPPRLQQRPQLLSPLDSNTPIGTVPPPSSAGPLTAKLNQNAVKLTDFFRTLLEDSLEKLDEPATQVTTLRLQLEQAKWKHQQQLDEIKHNHELTLAEVRASFEKEKMRAVNEARRLAHVELEAAVKQTKTKQWCANCSQEAQFYCCWNTSYCDYPCQRAHWPTHFNVCTQQSSQDLEKGNGDISFPAENRLQPKPDNLPETDFTVKNTKLFLYMIENSEIFEIRDNVLVNTMCLNLWKDQIVDPFYEMTGILRTPLEMALKWELFQRKCPFKKNTTTPALTVGGKLATPRPFTPDQQNSAQKTSIIMSMVEDNSGNQTMKCVGTYTAQKPPPPVTAASTPQVASLIINKQLMSTEETNTNKKVVTSGGYLIVGAGVNAGVNAGASRRMHTIQYYT